MNVEYVTVKNDLAFRAIKGKKCLILRSIPNTTDGVVISVVEGRDRGDYTYRRRDLEPWIEPEPKKKKSNTSLWEPMNTCPDGIVVIGLLMWPNNEDHGTISGIKYDLDPNCIINTQRGKWMRCTHWTYPPKE